MPYLDSPGWLDHALAALLLVALPLLARRNYGRLLSALESGQRNRLASTFRRTVLRQTALGSLLLLMWWRQGRPLAGLGLTAPHGSGFLAAAVVAAALLTYAAWQIGRVARDPKLRQQVRERLDATSVGDLLPRTRGEMSTFVAVALSAGIWEELLYRGFLIAWAGYWLGPVGGLLAAAVAFGIGHLYQGAAGVAKTTVAGLVAGGLLWLSGSLWIPMLLHAAVDLHAGALGLLAYRDDGAGAAR